MFEYCKECLVHSCSGLPETKPVHCYSRCAHMHTLVHTDIASYIMQASFSNDSCSCNAHCFLHKLMLLEYFVCSSHCKFFFLCVHMYTCTQVPCLGLWLTSGGLFGEKVWRLSSCWLTLQRRAQSDVNSIGHHLAEPTMAHSGLYYRTSPRKMCSYVENFSWQWVWTV